MNREEATETLKNYPCVCKYGTSPIKCTDTECDFGKAIRTLVERPKGKWIKKVDDVGFVSHICSRCGFELELEDCSDSYFCPNCGADMRGDL